MKGKQGMAAGWRAGMAGLAVMLATGLTGCMSASAGFSVDEQQNAKAAARMVEKEWPLRSINDPVTRYVQTLGQRLGTVTPEGKSVRWSFNVLRDRAPYAFSIGSGYVYLAEGSLGFARGEAELAAILAHEIGHQLSGYFSAPDRGRGSAPPQRQRVGSLTQVFDLEKEKDADRRAIFILQRAGYDPHALVEVLKRLPSGGPFHYYNDERRTQALTRELAGVPPQSRPDSREFRTIQELVRNEQGQ